jgi:hypothetical protein
MANPDMWASVRNGQRILLPFATATTLTHLQVIAYGIYILQGSENITR